MKRMNRAFWLAFAALLSFTGCGSDDGTPLYASPPCLMTAAITDDTHTMVQGSAFTVAINDVFFNQPPFVRAESSTWPGGTKIFYSLDITSVTPGDYHVYVKTSDPGNWGWTGPVALSCGSAVDVTIVVNMN